ncbi:MAG: hypothetical protein CR997_04845 [Acidobacteria bacterium]|nr:MAG: hypothetical protein CR997_04845 [Acidobacteriota bacterium]
MPKPGTFRRIIKRITLIGFSLVLIGLSGSLSTWLYLKHKVKGEIITTPNFYGKPIEAVRAELDRLGLILVIDPQKVPSNVVDVDKVVFQSPGPGKRIKKNRKIEVSLSSGVEIKRVPELKNQSIYFAKLMTEKLDTRISRASKLPSDKYKKGRVMAHSPKEGVEIPQRAGISVLLSEGPQREWFVMPEVEGISYSLSKAYFEENGFRVVTKYKYNAKLLPDEIIRQSPKPGYPVQKNATVTFEVNRIK